ncbi:hypothetical protein IPJ70_02005 [Candidatus Campbellbacteria bacterium]|nr:MAG: hypothetical protein IPJ70_02005 [Candidatus Campbellbacteria bacterium]
MKEPIIDNDSPIESLAKKLNTPGEDSLTQLHRSGFREERYTEVAQDFSHEHTHQPVHAMTRITRHHTPVKWFFIGAVIFFCASLLAASFFFSGDRNLVSANKIEITVTGPVVITAGEVLPLAIEVNNTNASALQLADILIEYPTGTRTPDDVTKELPRYRASLGTIPSGKSVATTTKAILFNEEGSTQTIIVSLEYRVAGSSAIFSKESSFAVRIGASPLTLILSAPRSINSGQDIDLTLDITSNSAIPLQDVVVAANYPFGFAFSAADPSPTFSDTVWALGGIEPKGKRTIHIRGALSGQNGEDRIFRFTSGIATQGDTTKVGAVFAQTDHAIQVARSFIDTRMVINGSSNDVVTLYPGRTARVDITWKNNLPTQLTDGVIEVTLQGEAVNEKKVVSTDGFYNSSKNTLTWTKVSNSALKTIDSGSQGKVSFSFDVLPTDTAGSGRINPEISLVLAFTANAVSESATPEEVRSDSTKVVRVASDVRLTSEAFRTTGPLENSGPVPPRVEQKTTYTVSWSVSNSVNDITGTEVKAVLPAYMSWESVVSPSSESISFDSSTREIIWRPGKIRAGSGFSTPARTVAFQIGLTPSATQIGSVPVILEDATLSATDSTVGGTVGDTAYELNTNLNSDPGFDSSWSRVVE